MSSHNIAVIGATGNVGRELVSVLAERNFPAKRIDALASSQSIGTDVAYGDSTLKAQQLEGFDFSQTHIVFSCAGATLSQKILPSLAEKVSLVIDNSSHFRLHKDVPLVIPEVNPDALQQLGNKRLVANPNCSTIVALLALAPLHRINPLQRVVAATYQSVSGAGRAAMDELFRQTKKIYTNEKSTSQHHTKQIAFNVIPHIDQFLDGGKTKEEQKMHLETKKILDENINLSALCVRVPVFVGHALALFASCEHPINLPASRSALNKAHGVTLFDKRQDAGYVTPVECAAEDSVFVSRMHIDTSDPQTLILWAVGDNLRKGAALNAVQIAEQALKDKIL